MKKTNKKGFTLVELIVVATIMVMVMGAILNFIRPMNKFYQRTQSLADTNDIGSILMDDVDDELRYATNIVVFQDYQGVPSLTGGFLTNTSGDVTFNAKFTNALIIDNENVRGSLFPGYDADGTVSHRKQARGCIMKANVTDAGIDTERLKCVGTEALYADYGCTFDAELNVLDNNSSCVTIDMELMRPRREGLGYVFDKFGYKQRRDFELVNVNLKGAAGRGMKAGYYGGSGNPIDYSIFTQASAVGGSADALYSQVHTYILYTKVVPTTEKVTVTVYKAPGSTTKVGQFKKNSGDTLDSGNIATIEAWGAGYLPHSGVYTGADGKKYKDKYMDAITADGTSCKDYMTMGITSNLDLYLQYVPIPMPDPTNTMTFFDLYDSGCVDQGGYNFKRSTYFYAPGTVEGEDGTVYFDATGNGDLYGQYTFVGWNLDPSATGEPDADPVSAMAAGWFVSGQQYTHDATYYAIYREEPMIMLTFEIPDGEGGGIIDFFKIRKNYTPADIAADPRIQNVTKVIEDNYTSGGALKFSHWNIMDPDSGSVDVIGKLGEVDLETLDGAYFLKPELKDNSHPGAYEIKIILDSDEEYKPWDSLVLEDKRGGGSSVGFMIGVYEDDGSTPIKEENRWWYYALTGSDYPFANGTVIKIYVYEDAKLGLSFKGKNGGTATGDSTYIYDGSSLYKAA